MPTRRALLPLFGLPLAGLLAGGCAGARQRSAIDAFSDVAGRTPDELAADEARWAAVQAAFDVDRSVANLNNGGCSPASRVAQDALHGRLDFANQLPMLHLWRLQHAEREGVRTALADTFGCDREELALTRNASESLETCLLGLDLVRGDEVLTTDQDYPRMVATLEQRARREGVVVKRLALPTPCEDEDALVALFEHNLTLRTRLILICHVVNVTGQILPVRRIVQMARRHGVPVVVDGAHAIAQLEFTRDELDCDFYGASLHKWLCAPHGTGMLYVRRERIAEVWPLMAAAHEQRKDIRKFEEVGTQPQAALLSVAEALVFHHAIGAANKLARLRFLRQRWIDRLRVSAGERLVLRTSLSPRFGAGFATFRIEGIEDRDLHRSLWERERVLTTPFGEPFPECARGLRVTPSVYTTLDEIDRFCAGVERCLRDGART